MSNQALPLNPIAKLRVAEHEVHVRDDGSGLLLLKATSHAIDWLPSISSLTEGIAELWKDCSFYMVVYDTPGGPRPLQTADDELTMYFGSLDEACAEIGRTNALPDETFHIFEASAQGSQGVLAKNVRRRDCSIPTFSENISRTGYFAPLLIHDHDPSSRNVMMLTDLMTNAPLYSVPDEALLQFPVLRVLLDEAVAFLETVRLYALHWEDLDAGLHGWIIDPISNERRHWHTIAAATTEANQMQLGSGERLSLVRINPHDGHREAVLRIIDPSGAHSSDMRSHPLARERLTSRYRRRNRKILVSGYPGFPFRILFDDLPNEWSDERINDAVRLLNDGIPHHHWELIANLTENAPT